MSKTIAESKLDLDYFESILLYNSFTNPEYLSSIIAHIDPLLFNDKNIGKKSFAKSED